MYRYTRNGPVNGSDLPSGNYFGMANVYRWARTVTRMNQIWLEFQGINLKIGGD